MGLQMYAAKVQVNSWNWFNQYQDAILSDKFFKLYFKTNDGYVSSTALIFIPLFIQFEIHTVRTQVYVYP